MGAVFQSFHDRFLERAARGFERRRKAMNHMGGELDVESCPSPESFVVCFVARARPAVILELAAKNRASLWIRSAANANRGKVLVRVQDVRFVDNADRLVETFEWTLAARYALATEGDRIAEQIVARWEELVVRAVAS
jgi:hypothetical protein